MQKLIIILLVMLSIGRAQGQERDTVFVPTFELEPFVFKGDDRYTPEEFMSIVMTDSSFYQAFMNLKYYPHSFTSTLDVFNKKEKEKGKLARTAKQHLDGQDMRWTEILSEQSNGKIYKKNGSHKYLTAEMYDELFFEEQKEKATLVISEYEQREIKGNKIDKYKSQLKKMMFNPGQEIVSVPFIGGKMAIFSEEMAEYYDYSVYTDYATDSLECYVFEVNVKPDIKPNKTVIKKMRSYFDKESMYVVDREYHLTNNTALFEFDIWMRVQNDIINGLLLPRTIRYRGDWDIPFKSAEIINFDIDCDDYSFGPE